MVSIYTLRSKWLVPVLQALGHSLFGAQMSVFVDAHQSQTEDEWHSEHWGPKWSALACFQNEPVVNTM